LFLLAQCCGLRVELTLTPAFNLGSLSPNGTAIRLILKGPTVAERLAETSC
jgi:hypothetical protein